MIYFVPTTLEQKNLLHKLYSYTFLDRFATYPCKKHCFFHRRTCQSQSLLLFLPLVADVVGNADAQVPDVVDGYTCLADSFSGSRELCFFYKQAPQIHVPERDGDNLV
jgi:hypothetical protein